MDEHKQLEDRWRELDELLGLAPATNAPAPAKSEPLPEAPVKPEPLPEAPPRAVEHAARIEESAPMPEEEPAEPAGWEAEFDEDADTEIMDQELPALEADEAAAETVEEAEPDQAGEDKPRRGRRRRRRGRRRGGEQDEAGPPRTEEPGRPKAEPRGQHTERRPVKAPATPEPDADDAEEFEHEPAARRLLTLDDTDFSNWDVPCWNDIVASLYRPDR